MATGAQALVTRLPTAVLVLALTWSPARADAAPPEDSMQAPKRGPRPAPAPTPAPERPLAEALRVEPGLTCLDRASLLEHLESWRESPSVDRRLTIRVRGSETNPRALGFEILIADEVAVERRFDPAPAECADLHAVVALAVAIALDDTLAGELGIVETEDPLAPLPIEPVEQAEAGEGDLPGRSKRPGEPAKRRPGPPLAVTAAGGVFAGVTPRLSAGALLSLDLRSRDHFDVRLGALVTHLPGLRLDSGEVDVSVAAGRVDLCWGTAPLPVRLRLCGGAAGGATVSRGSGFATSFRRTTPWFAAIAGVDVAVHLVGPLALELRVEGVFPLQRTRLDVRSETGQLLASAAFPVAGVLVAVGPRFEF